MQKKNKNGQAHDYLLKVIIIGDSGVGKTNLLTTFCQGVFKESYVATIGVDFKIKTLNIDNKKIKLQIWDTAGQERFRNIAQTYYKGAAGIILAYSINNSQSFRNIGSWLKQIQSNTSQYVSKVLIGTKSDLESDREVTYQQGKSLALRHGMHFQQVSAKCGSNVNQVFIQLARTVKDKKEIQTQQEMENLKLQNSKDKKKNCSC